MWLQFTSQIESAPSHCCNDGESYKNQSKAQRWYEDHDDHRVCGVASFRSKEKECGTPRAGCSSRWQADHWLLLENIVDTGSVLHSLRLTWNVVCRSGKYIPGYVITHFQLAVHMWHQQREQKCLQQTNSCTSVRTWTKAARRTFFDRLTPGRWWR